MEPPLRNVADETFQNTSSDKLANHPADIDKRSQETPKSQRAHLKSVGRAHNCEDAPRNPAEHLAGDQDVDIRRKEGQENKCRHHHQRDHDDLAMSKLLGHIAVDQQSNNRAAQPCISQRGLLAGVNDPLVQVRVVRSVLLLELRIRVEVPD